jgi:hypothetical protein
MSNEVTRTAAHVAADINKVKLNLAVAVVVSSIEIGRLLLEAKALVPHGEWGAWLAANVDFSESKAQSLMRRYKEYGDGQIDMITGTSDLDFFSFLSDSQMDALLALPRPERREFVEEHREELESGDMSVRAMKAEIARLKKENEQQAEDLETREEQIRVLENLTDDLQEKLDVERNKPAPEPVVQDVVTHQPSPEQIDKIRAAEEQRLRDEFEASKAKTLKECREAVAAAEKERDKAVEKAEKEANDAGELAAKMEKIKADHKAAMDKLNAEHASKVAELEASYKKQAKASAGADPNVMRIRLALEDFKRTVTVVSSTIGKMKEEGGEAAQKADKMKAQVETFIGTLITEAGWTV